jgi:predicted PurR-regulated permease PerM
MTAALPERPEGKPLEPATVRRRLAHRRARFLLGALLAFIGLWLLWDFLVPLVWAVVLAVATWPAYHWLVHGRPVGPHGRIMAPLGMTLLVGLVLMVPLALVIAELARELPLLARSITSLEREGMPPPDWVAHLPFVGSYAETWWQDNLGDPLAATELFGRVDRSILVGWTRNLGVQVLHRAADFVITLLTLFFLYRGGEALIAELLAVTDTVFGRGGERIGEHMVIAIKATVNGLILVGLGEGALLGVAYALLGMPHPILLGALTGVAAAIPFAAPLIFSIGAIVLFMQSGLLPAILLLAIGFIIVFIADHFVRPVLIGNATRLPFLWVLLGIFGGLQSFGLLGLFIGPAVLSSLMALWRELVPEPVAKI